MWFMPRKAFSLAVLILIPACVPFYIQQLPAFKDVIRDTVLHAVDVVQEQYAISEILEQSLPIIEPILQQRAAADLSQMANFLQGQGQLTDSVKSIMQLVVNPLSLASGTCNANSAPSPSPPPPNANFSGMLWEAKFTSKLGADRSFQGTVGLDNAGQGVKGFGIEVQPNSVVSDYSIGMQWSSQQNITGFAFAVSLTSQRLQSSGLADIHLIYSHPHWLCSSQCDETTFFQSPSDPSSVPSIDAGRVAQFLEHTVLQGFGVTFLTFNGPQPDISSVIDELLQQNPFGTLPLHLEELQAHLSSSENSNCVQCSFSIGDVTTIWTSATQYQGVSSSYCPVCGYVLQNPFDVDPSGGLAAIEGMMLTDQLEAYFTVGQPPDITAGLEGQATIGLSSGCDATHVLMATLNANLGDLVNLVEGSYDTAFISQLSAAMGDAAQLTVLDALLDISAGQSEVEVATIGFGHPWLPAQASGTDNLLVWLIFVAEAPTVNIGMAAHFHTQLKLEVGMQSLADTNQATILRIASQQGNGLDVKATMQLISEKNSQVSQDILVTMPLAVCMASCSSPLEERQVIYFTGNANPVPPGLTGRLSSDVNWAQAFGYPFMQISAMYMQVQWPINTDRPTEAQWQGALCLGTAEDCTAGQQPSIAGHVFSGINTNDGADGNYLIGELPQFKIGTLMDVVIGQQVSMQVAAVISNALVLPQGILSPEQCEFFEGKGFDGLSAAAAGCFVSLTFPQFTDRDYLPALMQLSGRLQLSNWLLSVTIGITNNVMTVEGPLPLWCLSIREVCEMKLGGVLNVYHAEGPSDLQMTLGQQEALLKISGVMEIPILKGNGTVTVDLVDDHTFRYIGPFSLLSGSWLTTATITWPVDMFSFLVEMAPVHFAQNIPVLTDVRYYVDGSPQARPDDSFRLNATWKLFSFVEPNTVVDFIDDKMVFAVLTSGLEGAGDLLANTTFDVFGEGQLMPSGSLEGMALRLTMTWQVERELNTLISGNVVDMATTMAYAIRNVTLQMVKEFQEVQGIFNTTLLPVRNALAWGLENITTFLSTEFGMALAAYDGIYVREPINLYLSYNLTKGLTGAVNKYGCPVYVICKPGCNEDHCKAHPSVPYVRSDCMEPKISALNIVRGLQYAMALRQAEIETTVRTNPSLVAIVQTMGLLDPTGDTYPLSTLIPHIPVVATVYLNPSNSRPGRRLLQEDCGPACLDYNKKKTHTATPTKTSTRTMKKLGDELHVLDSKFAIQDAVPKLIADVEFDLRYHVDITDSTSFGKSIQRTSASAAAAIVDLIAADQQRWDGLDVLLRKFSTPSLSSAATVILPCTGGDMYGFPPVAQFDPACAEGATVRVIEAVTLPSPCAQAILKLKWQAFDNATCAGKSNVVEQIVIQGGPSQLHFATFPSNVTIINNMTLGLGVLGKPTSPPPECNLTSTISFNDNTPRRLSPPGPWVVERVWSIVPTKVWCINSDDEAAYAISMSYSQVQYITIQDKTSPRFTNTPSTPLVLDAGTEPVPSTTGTPTASDPVSSDVLAMGVSPSNVVITYGDVVTDLPDLVMNCHTGYRLYRRTWQATDESGNSAAVEQLIYVKTN